MRVFVTRSIPDAGIDMLKKEADVSIWSSTEELTPSRGEIIEEIKKADACLCLLTETIDREIMEANPRLLGIANYAVGYNNIDIAAATELGIPVTNTPDVLTDTTADLTWALLLAIARNIVQGHKYVTEGLYKAWEPKLLLGTDVSPGGQSVPKTLGIIGFGRIGQAVFKRSKGFDMRVIACDPLQKNLIDATDGIESCDLSDLLKKSDFITIHTILDESTRHLIGKQAFDLMKPTAYLINAARGPIVDEEALVAALKNKRIAGAALDVFEHEPALTPGLAECNNVILLPHLGSATQETRDKMSIMAASNALALLNLRKAPNTINPEVYSLNAYKRRIESK